MRITGAHAVIYTPDADADRAFFRDVLKLPNIDAGGGWLIFALPPAEVAMHPGEKSGHELYLTCDDVEAFAVQMKAHGLACEPVRDLRWGLLTNVTLPGGGKLGVYQPRHARPKARSAARSRRTAPARKRTRGRARAR